MNAPADERRVRILRECGAGGSALDELLEYTRPRFQPWRGEPPLPLIDEPHLEAWDGYAARSREEGTFEVLAGALVQLRFPVREGISGTDAYRAATRRGQAPPAPVDGGVRLEAPERLELRLHPTPAGRLPVLVAGTRTDFVTLVRALAYRNEPVEVPAAMGACLVHGLNNWDRAERWMRRWTAPSADRDTPGERAAALRALAPRRELYQDRLVLLSRGPYSATRALDVGMRPSTWLAASLRLRLEHECAHYFTLRVLGSTDNSLLDELIADYAGISAVAGRFRADWFLRFLGLEHPELLRSDGRLARYRGTPPLSDPAFAALQCLVRRAAHGLERHDAQWRARAGPRSLPDRLLAIAALGLDGLAIAAQTPADTNRVMAVADRVESAYL